MSHGGEPQMPVAGLGLDIPQAEGGPQRSLNGGYSDACFRKVELTGCRMSREGQYRRHEE